MRKPLIISLLLFCCFAARAQAPQDDAEHSNERKARAAVDAMVRALGGPLWLSMQNVYLEGRVSGFYQGKPTGAIENFYTWRTPLGEERTEFSKKHDDVVIFTGKECWEATYKGKKATPKDVCDDYLRRRDHSIDTAIRVWLKDPNTVLISEGQTLAERHLADQVTLISSSNDSITIQMDADTHLPLSRTFQWRDPVYKDKNEEREEYDDYHIVQGIPTPFTVTRFHNRDMISQRFLYKAAYNVPLPADGFDIDAVTTKVKK